MATTDGTQLNVGAGGDLVSDEDLTGQPRQTSAVPQLGAANASYKLERTKIVAGEYGQDAGDVSAATPLMVRAHFERQSLEETSLSSLVNKFASLSARDRGARQQHVDARGHVFRGSMR